MSYGGKTLKAKKSAKTGRWSARIDLRKVTSSRLRITTRTRVAGGRTVTRTRTYDRCPKAAKKAAKKKTKKTGSSKPTKKKT